MMTDHNPYAFEQRPMMETVPRSWWLMQCWSFIKFHLAILIAFFIAVFATKYLHDLLWPGKASSWELMNVLSMEELFLFFLFTLFLISVEILVVCWPFVFFVDASHRTNNRRNLSLLLQNCLKSNTPIPPVIRAWAETQKTWYYRQKLRKVANMLEAGVSLTETLQRCPGMISEETAALLRLHGDASESVSFINESTENEDQLAFIHTVSMSRFVYLLFAAQQFIYLSAFSSFFLVREMEAIFADFDTELPRITQWVLFLFHTLFSIRTPFVLFILAIGILIFILLKLDFLHFRPWLMHHCFRYGDSAKLLRLLSMGTQNGLTIPHTLEVYRSSVSSYYLRRRAKKIGKAIDSGTSWIDALRCRKVITAAEAALLETSARTGNVESVLNELSLTNEAKQIRYDELFGKITFVICILMAGVVVGIMAVAMLFPMDQLIKMLT